MITPSCHIRPRYVGVEADRSVRTPTSWLDIKNGAASEVGPIGCH